MKQKSREHKRLLLPKTKFKLTSTSHKQKENKRKKSPILKLQPKIKLKSTLNMLERGRIKRKFEELVGLMLPNNYSVLT